MTASIRTSRRNKRLPPLRGTFGASLKAGLMGGFAISLLLTVYQIAPDFLQTVLIPPALVIVWLVTGIGAAMLCHDKIRNSHDGASVGMVAGIITGLMGGITGMIIAALGLSFQFYGESLFNEALTDTQIASLIEAGFTNQLIILFGSIMTALFTCGFGGIFIAAILGRIGGWLYPKFSR